MFHNTVLMVWKFIQVYVKVVSFRGHLADERGGQKFTDHSTPVYHNYVKRQFSWAQLFPFVS